MRTVVRTQRARPAANNGGRGGLSTPFTASAVLYGYAGSGAGHPSPNVSFGVFISFLVLGSNALGLSTGELRGASRRVSAGLLFSAGGLVAGAWLLNAR